LLNYVRRIQAAGWQRSKQFPAERPHWYIILAGADLTGVDFSGARLIGADLSGANLNRASLRQANLLSANLSGAQLGGADLQKAKFYGADLTDVKCTQEQLNSAQGGRSSTVIPAGLERPRAWKPPQGRDPITR
jgi:uncharacterized protein YjbI with pentapeptide repeats